MDLKNLKLLIDSLIVGKMSDSFATREILKFLYANQAGSLREMILMIDEIEKEKSKEREALLCRGLEDAMHGFSNLASSIENRDGKTTSRLYFDSGNPAYLLWIARAYFKNATSDGCSQAGKYFFDKLVSLIITTRADYLPGGKSHAWAIEFGHLEYIQTILANYDKNVPKNLDLT
jgi:hypothetical protein